jgi:hypothetical protein
MVAECLAIDSGSLLENDSSQNANANASPQSSTASGLPFAAEVQALPYAGVPCFGEWALFHKRSASLIVSDTVTHMTSDSTSGMTWFIGKVGAIRFWSSCIVVFSFLFSI